MPGHPMDDQHVRVLPRNLTKLGYINSAMLNVDTTDAKLDRPCTSEVQRTYIAYMAPTQVFRSMVNFIGSYCNSVAGQAICVPLTVVQERWACAEMGHMLHGGTGTTPSAAIGRGTDRSQQTVLSRSLSSAA
ncbi:hypothetical protein HPB47_009940 [Ixodes persulcatus]|uniref:Uncharacterized protein n=1 Tax=Ixodes persulcatus TaxID=34615 RepID=A0AC60P0J9_IXOPE|nr:hypothetical protein HPB47_009940 [Ixodes persulcatus]